MNHRILLGIAQMIFGGGSLFLGLTALAGDSVLVQGDISGVVHEGDKKVESELNKFEADYSGQSATAMDASEKKQPVTPKVREILKEAGLLYYQRRFPAALTTLKKAEKIDPGSSEVLNAKAAILSESGDLAEARKIYSQLAVAQPKAFVPRYDLAELLLMAKKYDEARQAFQELLKAFPNCDLARFKILLIALIQKDSDGADAMLATLKQRGPSAIGDYALAANAISYGDIGAGRQWIESAEADFGGGNHRVLYDSLADIGFVPQGEYPPKN